MNYADCHFNIILSRYRRCLVARLSSIPRLTCLLSSSLRITSLWVTSCCTERPRARLSSEDKQPRGSVCGTLAPRPCVRYIVLFFLSCVCLLLLFFHCSMLRAFSFHLSSFVFLRSLVKQSSYLCCRRGTNSYCSSHVYVCFCYCFHRSLSLAFSLQI